MKVIQFFPRWQAGEDKTAIGAMAALLFLLQDRQFILPWKTYPEIIPEPSSIGPSFPKTPAYPSSPKSGHFICLQHKKFLGIDICGKKGKIIATFSPISFFSLEDAPQK
jgi:hypothetical protein